MLHATADHSVTASRRYSTPYFSISACGLKEEYHITAKAVRRLNPIAKRWHVSARVCATRLILFGTCSCRMADCFSRMSSPRAPSRKHC